MPIIFQTSPSAWWGPNPRYPEIPTIPSGTEEIIKALEKIPLQEIVLKATKALEGIERLINSPETRSVAKNLNTTLKDFQKVAGDVRTLALKDVDRPDRDPLAAEAKDAMKDARTLLQGADKEIVPLAAGLKKTLDEAGGVLAEARQTLKKASNSISEESVLSAEF